MNRFLTIILKTWLVLWVIGLPWVHIHPEIDHAHGMPGHVHGGTFHTVLSNTPVCAFEDHQHHHTPFSSGEPVGASHSFPHFPHGIEHSTYDFSVLASLIDPILGGKEFSSIGDTLVAGETEYPIFSTDASIEPFSIVPSVSVSLPLHSARAPPILSE